MCPLAIEPSIVYGYLTKMVLWALHYTHTRSENKGAKFKSWSLAEHPFARKLYLEHEYYLERLEYDFEYYERMRNAAEEEFVQSGPTHLLEAVYCDPCKSRVIEIFKKYVYV